MEHLASRRQCRVRHLDRAGVGNDELDRALENPRNSHPDLPQVFTVMTILDSDGAPSLSEFLDIFDAPVNIDLDDENVWPMPPQLVF